MRHKRLADMHSPIARSLERIGEWWSIRILADAFRGLARFDQFRESLGAGRPQEWPPAHPS